MKGFLITTIALSAVLTGQAQYFTGLNGSAYGGITTVNFNPAIAGGPFIADINLIGAAAAVNNNYLGVNRDALTHPALFGSSDFQSADLNERINGKDKNLYAGAQIQGPLSFMFSFGKKKKPNKNAIAFSYHTNFILNIDNVNETLARSVFYGLGGHANAITHFVGQNLNDANLGIKALAWNDYGVTYSRVILDQGGNVLKVGGTLKLLQPLAGAYMYSPYVNYKWPEQGELSLRTNVNYAYSQGLISSRQFSAQDISQSASGYAKDVLSYKYSVPTAAADLGAIYEWRPDKYTDDMDCSGKTGYEYHPYKLAAGFSIIDFGAVRFRQGQYSGNFNANIQDWEVSNAKFPNGIQSLDDTIHSRLLVSQSANSFFTMWLPTRFNLFVDYNIKYGFGVLGSATISPNMAPARNMVHQVTVFSATPKYENKWFGFYMPLSYDIYGNFGLGTTLRIGPLVIGTQDILAFFARRYVYKEEVHAAVKITIPYFKTRHKYDVRFQKKV